MQCTVLIFAPLLLAPLVALQAGLGMYRVSYGVWEQEGFIPPSPIGSRHTSRLSSLSVL